MKQLKRLLSLKRTLSFCIAFAMLAGAVFSGSTLQALAADGRDDAVYIAEIGVELQDEDGNDVIAGGMTGVNFYGSSVTVSKNSIIVMAEYSGRALNFTSDISYTSEEFEPVPGTAGIRYEFSVTDITEQIPVQIVAGGAAGGALDRYLTFLPDEETIKKIAEIYEGPAETDDGNETTGSETGTTPDYTEFLNEDGTIKDGGYTIETISVNAEDDTIPFRAVHEDPVSIAVADGDIKAYVVANSTSDTNYGTLSFTGEGLIDFSQYDVVNNRNVYELNIKDMDEYIHVQYGNEGYYYNYRFLFDITTLAAENSDDENADEDGSEGDNGTGESDYFMATHTIEYEFTDAEGTAVAPGGTTFYTAELAVSDKEVVVHMPIAGREFFFQNDSGEYTNDVISYDTDSTIRVYRLVFDDISALNEEIPAQFVGGGAAGGVVSCTLKFDISTLAETDGSGSGQVTTDPADTTDPSDTADPSDTTAPDVNEKTGTATFSIKVQAQDEEGNVNEARDAYINENATLKVSKGSLEVTFKASERELFLLGEDGESITIFTGEKDGDYNIYELALQSMDELEDGVTLTFPTTGDNPYYSDATPEFILAFIIDDDDLAKIKDIYENGIESDVDYTKQDSEDEGAESTSTGADSGSSDSSDSGSSSSAAKTGDSTATGYLFFMLLCACTVIGYGFYLKKKKEQTLL